MVMDEKARVLAKLDELGVSYELDVHEPVYTIDAMAIPGLDKKGEAVKNLFLRDAKGKRHFLVVLPGGRQGNLKAIRARLWSTALSFGSEERLMRCLRLSKGAVSPLGVLNDADRTVDVVFDWILVGAPLGVHPNDNTATVWISYEGLRKVVEHCGNTIHLLIWSERNPSNRIGGKNQDLIFGAFRVLRHDPLIHFTPEQIA